MEIPHRALRNARAALQGGMADSGGQRLLDWLGWAGPVSDALLRDRLALLGVALLCRRVFGLEAPGIPGLCTIGAEAMAESVGGEAGQPPLTASGVGCHPGDAFARCLGEMAERLAQVETPEDRRAWGGGVIPLAAWPEGTPREWPAHLLLRRRARPDRPPPPSPLSIGCAAAATQPEARLGALLEVIERDAVALWWRGGRRVGGLAPDHPAVMAAGLLLEALGYPSHSRRFALLDLTGEAGAPVVAALAFDRDDQGFCCGTACRADWAAAGRAAALELCQNELAVALARARHDGGLALGPRDAAHLRRHATVRAADCLTGVAQAPAQPLPGAPAEAFDALASRLRSLGHPVLLHRHERDWLDMAVIRVVVPGLACEPSSETPPRLRAAQQDHAGRDMIGPGQRYGISLFA